MGKRERGAVWEQHSLRGGSWWSDVGAGVRRCHLSSVAALSRPVLLGTERLERVAEHGARKGVYRPILCEEIKLRCDMHVEWNNPEVTLGSAQNTEVGGRAEGEI